MQSFLEIKKMCKFVNMYFVECLLPLALEWIPTFSSEEKLEAGTMVNVLFSGRKYKAIVWNSDVEPKVSINKIKPIISTEKDFSKLSEKEKKFWEFLADYYLCSLNEVYRIAYPSFRIKGETTAINRLTKMRQKLQDLDTKLQERANNKRANKEVTQRLQIERDTLFQKLQIINTKPISNSTASTTLVSGSFNKRIVLYQEEIKKALELGGQVLVLCPDISFVNRIRTQISFEAYINTYKTTDAQRYNIASSLRNGESALVIGTKTSLFLAFSSLSLIIIDEEQDSLYKHNEFAPRFNARDAAVYLSKIHNSKVLLGSAVPSLESYNNHKEGKYALINLDNSRSNYEVVNILDQRQKHGMIGSFSAIVIKAIKDCSGSIVILRTWDKITDIQDFISSHFIQKDIQILTLNELKRSNKHSFSLLVVLSGDGLVNKDDFRSDEKALQISGMLCDFADKVIIQTAVEARFDGSRSLDTLLKERNDFSFPPFTRLINICHKEDNSVIDRVLLQRNSSLNKNKHSLIKKENTYFDVDPI